MIVTIMGKRWKLEFKPLKGCKGECDGPHIKDKKIVIKDTLKGELLLDTIIHECAHAADWQKDEEFIQQQATDLARILWRLGYRRLEETPHDEV